MRWLSTALPLTPQFDHLARVRVRRAVQYALVPGPVRSSGDGAPDAVASREPLVWTLPDTLPSASFL